jgi:hypothetical protein
MEDKNQIIEEALIAFGETLGDLYSEYYRAWENTNTMQTFDEYMKYNRERLSKHHLLIEKAREAIKG